MNVLVPVKRVIDANVRVRVKSDQSGVDLDNVKMAINTFGRSPVSERPARTGLPRPAFASPAFDRPMLAQALKAPKYAPACDIGERMRFLDNPGLAPPSQRVPAIP